MDLLLLRSLLAVAKHGVLTDAARAIGVSQSALSRRIAQLEAELGAELLDRSGRGVRLTSSGELAVREGALIVQRYERLQSEVKAELRVDTGRIRLGGGATAVGFVLPEAIASFQRRHPGVVFQLKEAGSRDIELAVVNDELELGLVTLPVHSRELDVTPLRKDAIVLVCGKGHPLAQRRSVSVSDLQGLAVVGFEAGSAIRRLIDGALQTAHVEMNVVMELRSVAAILKMIESTSSLAFVSELAVEGDIARRRLRGLRVRGLSIERELALVRAQRRRLSPAAAKFVELLLKGAI